MTITCIHCGSNRTNKAGFTRGKQRFYCHDCQRFSRENLAGRKKADGKKSYRERVTGKLPSKGTLALELQGLFQGLKRTPTTKDITHFAKKNRCHHLICFYAVFGDFISALKTARIPLRYKQEFNKEQLLSELRALHKKLKRPLIQKDVAKASQQGHCSFVHHFQRAFGSVPNAIREAGAGKKKPTRDELIRQLKKLNRELGKPPRKQEITEAFHKGKCASLKMFLKEFGTIKKARRAAGIVAGAWRPYTRQQLIEQLKQLGQKLGRKPSGTDINKASARGEMAHSVTFVSEFGSLTAAYKLAGFEVKPQRKYTQTQIIRDLQQLTRRLRRVPGYVDIMEASKKGLCASPNTIYRHFGLLEVAKRKARLESILSRNK